MNVIPLTSKGFWQSSSSSDCPVVAIVSCQKKLAGSLASKSMCDNRDGVVKVEEEAECKIIQREKRGRYLNYLIESSGDKI